MATHINSISVNLGRFGSVEIPVTVLDNLDVATVVLDANERQGKRTFKVRFDDDGILEVSGYDCNSEWLPYLSGDGRWIRRIREGQMTYVAKVEVDEFVVPARVKTRRKKGKVAA